MILLTYPMGFLVNFKVHFRVVCHKRIEEDSVLKYYIILQFLTLVLLQ